jgi:hypothetical protein
MLRSSGALRWKVEHHRLGRSGSELRKADTSKVVAPLVSVKYRWVGPCEQVLNVPIACQRYETGKPSSWSSTDDWLCPHYFNGCLGRETRYGPADRSTDVLWIVSGVLFLRSTGPSQLCWWLRKRLLCVDCVRYVWSGTIRGLSVECMWRVGQVSPAGCTSIRITAILEYE